MKNDAIISLRKKHNRISEEMSFKICSLILTSIWKIHMARSTVTFKVVKILPTEEFRFIILSTDNDCLVVARNHLDYRNMVINKKDKVSYPVELNIW